MARYEYNGQTFEAPDDMPFNEVLKVINAQQANQASTKSPAEQDNGLRGGNTPPSLGRLEVGEHIDPDKLKEDPKFLHSAAVYYEMMHGNKASERVSPQELVDEALSGMSWFNYNLPNMGVNAYKIKQASPEQKQAFLHLLDTSENLQYSWAGAGRFAKAAVLDPTNYVGLSSLGIGLVGKEGAKAAGKREIKELLRHGLIAGIEGSMLGAANEATREQAIVNADGQDSINWGNVGKVAAITGAAGVVLGAGSKYLGTKFGKEVERPTDLDHGPIGGKPPASPMTAEEAEAARTTALAEADARKATETPKEAPVAAEATPVAPEAEKPASEAPKAPAEAPKGEATPEPVKLLEEPKANEVLNKVKAVVEDSGLRKFPRTRNELEEASRAAMEELLATPEKDFKGMLEELRRTATTGEQWMVLRSAIRQAADGMLKDITKLDDEAKAGRWSNDPVAQAKMLQMKDDLYKTWDMIRRVDQAGSSLEGAALNANKAKVDTRDHWEVTAENLMRQDGIDPEKATVEQHRQYADAVINYFRNIGTAVAQTAKVKAIEAKMQELGNSGDIAGLQRLIKDREATKAVLADAQAKADGIVGSTRWGNGTGANFFKGMVEAMIGMVFSPSTIIINTLPSLAATLYRPALDSLVRGGDMAARRQMTATYGAMLSSVGTAFKAARAAFEYERGLMHGDFSKFMDGQKPVIPDWMGGRLVRFFPRVTQATDEFFSVVHYRGFVAGQAAAEATEQGLARGMKGQELKDFIAKNIKYQTDRAFSQDINVPHVVDFLRENGIMRGYQGDNLDKYIMDHLQRDRELFKQAMDQYGKDYSDDIMFKRQFSGDNPLSRAALEYEQLVNRWPIMRVFGQLFFRTPVRVFEEGFRLTPGLNLVSPKFLSDLRGLNGEARQVRAQGEALMSYAIAGAVINLYAQGRITGGGPGNFRDKRTLQDSNAWGEYAIKFNDGSTFGFRNLDPLATPMKIIVNALDAYAALTMREAQGEVVEDQYKHVLGLIGAATGAIAGAIKDANLLEGVAEISQLWQDIQDPERNATAITRYVSNKITAFVPNTYKKWNAIQHPELNDPATMEQFLLSATDPSNPRIPKQYTVLGRVRERPNPIAGLTAFNYDPNGFEVPGMSPEERYVEKRLAEISQLNGMHFFAPTKLNEEGVQGQDLRQLMSADGKTSLYDLWNREVHQSGVINALYTALKASENAAVGTPKVHGVAAEAAKQILDSARKVAWDRVIQKDSEAKAKMMKYLTQEYPAKLQQDRVPMPFIGQ